MSDKLSVSVVIPVLNGAETIGDTLTAILNQRHAPCNAEVIVVDNGSTDGTPEIARRFPVVLTHESVRGASAARNRGIRQAHGEVVAFLDADTLPSRRWLAELVAPFVDSHVMLVGGQMMDYLPRTPPERFMASMGTFKLEYTLFRQSFPYISSGTLAVRRAAALEIGGWDETLATAEDLDFCVRMVRRFSCSMLRQPHAILFNRHRSTDESLRRQAWGYGQGLAQVQRRYPDVIRLNVVRFVYVGWILSVRWMESMTLGAGCRLGVTSDARAEFARYHWFWSRWFWTGFLNARQASEQLSP